MPNNFTSSQLAIKEYLTEENFSSVTPEIPGQLAMRGKIVTNGVEYDTLITVEADVPASYPKFYTVNNRQVFKQPHIERPRNFHATGKVMGMCFKREVEKLYNANPVDLIHKNLTDYLRLCDDLAYERFNTKKELFDEFDSYWDHSKTIHRYMKETPSDKQMVTLILLDPINKREGLSSQILILTDTQEDVEHFAQRSGYTTRTMSSPFIDFGQEFDLPIPYTYGDFTHKLTKSGHLKFIKKLQDKNVGIFLIFAFDLPLGEKHFAAVFLRDDMPKELLNKNVNRYSVFFNKKFETIPLHGAHIKSIDRRWLMQRAGNSTAVAIVEKKFKVAIVGCGSVGSNLAYKLCKCGIGNMVLIDPGILQSDNVGRHFLGMNSVGGFKVDLMADVLQSQFIGINIDFYHDKAQQHIKELLDVDLIITAIGSDSPAVEPFMANLVQQGELPPMVICWLEAEAVAGHALYVDTELPATLEFTTDKMDFIDPEYANSLVISEVGCNSEFMPYMHLDADEHINKMVRFILDIIKNERRGRALSSFGVIGKFIDHLQYDAKENTVLIWQDKDFSV